MILSVGYRVKSSRGIMFRRWSNTILKQYLLKGHAINQRLELLERRVSDTEEKINFFVQKSLPPVEGIFYDGQIFDAYVQIVSLKDAGKKLFAYIRMQETTALDLLAHKCLAPCVTAGRYRDCLRPCRWGRPRDRHRRRACNRYRPCAWHSQVFLFRCCMVSQNPSWQLRG